MYHASDRYVIQNVELWTAHRVERGRDIEVCEGVVTSIRAHAAGSTQAKLINGEGLTLLPAGIDPQVHLRVPGQAQKELPATGLHAALRGGYAAVLTMPNTKPVLDDPEILRAAKQEILQAELETGVKVLFSAAITKGLKGQQSPDYAALAASGVKAFTDDGLGVASDDLMRAVFKASVETKLPVLQHAEVAGHGAVLAAGPLQQRLGLKPYPVEAETAMVARDLQLLSEFPEARYHVLHVSAEATLELIAEARAKGLEVTCEVSPHHLWYSANDIVADNSAFKMNPPLRGSRDRLALRAALRTGLIDFVATDHAPHEESVKTDNFKTAAFGTTGLETSLRVLLSLWAQGELTAERLVQVFSTRPAEFLDLADEFGEIAVGRELKAVLVDTRTRSTVTPADLYSLSKNNCFLGESLQGSIQAVLLGRRHYNFG